MNNISQLAKTMQKVLGDTADELGRKTGFIKRKVKNNR